MKELTKEYTILFNSISDTITKLDKMKTELISCQQLAEEFYIRNDENDIGLPLKEIS